MNLQVQLKGKMDERKIRMMMAKMDTMELLIKVLLDDLIENDLVDFDDIMEKLDKIEKKTDEQRKKQKQDLEEKIPNMYFGPKGEA